MLTPADGREGIVKFAVETAKLAGPNACPPIILGIGIGGSFEYSALLAKKALLRKIGQGSSLTHIAALEVEARPAGTTGAHRGATREMTCASSPILPGLRRPLPFHLVSLSLPRPGRHRYSERREGLMAE